MRIVDRKISGGPLAQEGDFVLLLYKCALDEEKLDNNCLLDSNYGPDTPLEVEISKKILIPCLTTALVGMRSGGSVRRVWLDSIEAFGSEGWANVPPHMNLVFDLCLIRRRPR